MLKSFCAIAICLTLSCAASTEPPHTPLPHRSTTTATLRTPFISEVISEQSDIEKRQDEKNAYIGREVEWRVDGMKVAFFEAKTPEGDLDVFGDCEAVSAVLAGKLKIRGTIRSVDAGRYLRRVQISDAVIEPVIDKK